MRVFAHATEGLNSLAIGKAQIQQNDVECFCLKGSQAVDEALHGSDVEMFQRAFSQTLSNQKTISRVVFEAQNLDILRTHNCSLSLHFNSHGHTFRTAHMTFRMACSVSLPWGQCHNREPEVLDCLDYCNKAFEIDGLRDVAIRV